MKPTLPMLLILVGAWALPAERAVGQEMAADLVPAPAGANAYCPVTTNEQADARYSTEYAGKTIYFCCGKCRKKFLAHPEQYLAQLHLPAAEPARASAAPRWQQWAGKIHPLAVHFPIALTLAAGLAESLNVLRRAPGVSAPARFCLGLAALTAPFTVAMGWANASAFPSPAESLHVLAWHRWLGVGAASAIVVALLASWKATGSMNPGTRLAYRLVLLLAVALVAGAGHFGGLLAYGSDYFTKL